MTDYVIEHKNFIQGRILVAQANISYYKAMEDLYPDDPTFKPLRERNEENLVRLQKELEQVDSEK